MTAPAIMNQVRNMARQSANSYTVLYNTVFNNPVGVTAAEVATGLGSSGQQYFGAMTALLAVANACDTTLVDISIQTYPNTVTVNSDGTVTLS